jgi:hypothetical protein
LEFASALRVRGPAHRRRHRRGFVEREVGQRFFDELSRAVRRDDQLAVAAPERPPGRARPRVVFGQRLAPTLHATTGVEVDDVRVHRRAE